MNKKLTAAIACAALTATMLTGCAKTVSSGLQGDASTSGGSQPKVDLTLLTWHGPDSATNFYDGYAEAVKDYTALHPNVKIDIRYEADDTFGSILETGFAGKTAPDIIQMKSSQRLTYKEDILNIRDYLTKQNPYDKRNESWAENFEGGLAAFPVEEGGGDTNALLFVANDTNPTVYSGLVYVYNKKLIKDAGLDPEVTPITWTDMFKWLEAIKAGGEIEPMAGHNEIGSMIGQIGFGFGEDYDSLFFDEKYNDPEFINDLYWDKIYVLTCYDKSENMPLDNVKYYPAAFDMIKQFISYYQKSWPENTIETRNLTFASGKAAMMSVGSWDYSNLLTSLSENKFPDGYGTFRIPYMGEDTLDYAVTRGWTTKEKADAARPYASTRPLKSGGTGLHDSGFVINKAVSEDANKEAAAVDFLQFFSSYDQQLKYVETADSFSPIKGVPVPETLNAFVTTEPESGWGERVMGLYGIEWGASDWPVEMMKYLKGEQELDITVKNISSPSWAADIPTLETLQANVDTAKTELETADTSTKADKERAYTYAQLRRDLYDEYYYNASGDLKPLR